MAEMTPNGILQDMDKAVSIQRRLTAENDCPFVDNELPYGRAVPGHPVIVDYFYHEEIRGLENTGKRKKA